MIDSIVDPAGDSKGVRLLKMPPMLLPELNEELLVLVRVMVRVASASRMILTEPLPVDPGSKLLKSALDLFDIADDAWTGQHGWNKGA